MSLEIKDLLIETEPNKNSLAMAMAARYWYEHEWFNDRLRKYNVAVGNETPSIITFSRVQATAPIFEEALRNPTPSNIRECYDSISTMLQIENVEDAMAKDPEMESVFDPEHLGRKLSEISNKMLSPIAETRIQKLVTSFEEANKMSEELKVNTAQIYLDERLYEELIRRVYKPEDIDKIFNHFKNINPEDFISLIVDSFVASINPNILGEQEMIGVFKEQMTTELGLKFSPVLTEVMTSTEKVVNDWSSRFWK